MALSRWGVLLSLNQKGNERCFNTWHSVKCFAFKARVDLGLVQNGTSLPSTTFSWQSMQIQNPYTLASKGRLSPERHPADMLWLRLPVGNFDTCESADFSWFLHVFSRDTQEGKLPALCQLAMEAPGQHFSLHSHHAAHGSFASGALSSVCTAAEG